MVAKILLVEDNELFRDALIQLLEKNNHEVKSCGNGKEAQSVLGIEAFDLVLSDIRMPQMSGIELLHWIKKEKKDTSVILMTGFSEVLSTYEAAEIGADGFLPKPFEPKDLMNLIQKLSKKSNRVPVKKKNLDQEFCKIFTDDFISGSQIPYPIYIRITASNYIKIAYQGQDLPRDRITLYHKKGVRFLYLKKEDFRKYVDLNLVITKVIKEQKSMEQEKIVNFLRHTGEVILEQLSIPGVEDALVQDAKTYIDTTFSILEDHEGLMMLLKQLNAHGDFLYAHALGVAVVGVLIARELGWNSSSTIYKVAMAGIFHDIGKKELDRSILELSRVRLTQEQRAIYETHPLRGAEILEQIGNVPLEVVQVAAQHHEEVHGYGFPRKLTKTHITPLARLIAVSNVFCNYAIKNPNSKGMSAQDAITQMNQFRKDGLDPEFFAALKKALFNDQDALKKSA